MNPKIADGDQLKTHRRSRVGQLAVFGRVAYITPCGWVEPPSQWCLAQVRLPYSCARESSGNVTHAGLRPVQGMTVAHDVVG